MDNSFRQVTFHMLFNQLHNPCFPLLGVYGSQPPLVGCVCYVTSLIPRPIPSSERNWEIG